MPRYAIHPVAELEHGYNALPGVVIEAPNAETAQRYADQRYGYQKTKACFIGETAEKIGKRSKAILEILEHMITPWIPLPKKSVFIQI